MAKKLTAVDTSFFDTARIRPTFTVRINQPIDRVFAAIADDAEGWSHWFPGFKPGGHYVDDGLTGKVGATRVVNASGQTMSETVIAWDVPTRWAFTLVEARMPGVRSLAEDYRLAADGDATVLSWTMAMDAPPVPMGVLIRVVGGRLIARAGKNLERYLDSQPAA